MTLTTIAVLMITSMASEAHDVETSGPDRGAVAGMPSGLAAPGGTLSTPSGDTAGPAHSPTPAEHAVVRWEMPFWGRPVGHTERLELTELVRGILAGGQLTRLDADGQAVTTPPAAITPAEAEAADEGDGAAKRPRRRT